MKGASLARAIAGSYTFVQVNGFRLQPLLVRLGEEFKRRGMRKHAAALRRYYAARARRLREQQRDEPGAWTDDLVFSWLCALRITPFDHVYEVLPSGAQCPCGVATHDGAGPYVEFVFAGGYVWHCQACGRTWLAVEEEHAS